LLGEKQSQHVTAPAIYRFDGKTAPSGILGF
jgi:hypothetical protein